MSRKLRFRKVFEALKPHRYVLVGIAAYSVIFSWYSVYKHYAYETYAWDLGIFCQALWTTAFEGKLFYYTPELYANPSGSFLAWHPSLLMFFLAGLYRLIPRPEFLLILQSILLALGAVPIYLIARERLGEKASYFLTICYFLYSPLHGVNAYDFHLEAFVPLFFGLSFYEWMRDKYWRALLWACLVMASASEFCFLIVCLSFYWLVKKAIEGHLWKEPLRKMREKSMWFPVLVLLICVTWYSVAASLATAIRGTAWEIPTHFKRWGATPTEILVNVLTHPVDAFKTMFLDARKVSYVAWLLVPLLFLPLLAPLEFIILVGAWLWPALLTDYPPYFTDAQYPALVTAQVFIGAIEGLKNLGGLAEILRRAQRVNKWRDYLVVGILASSVVTAYVFSPLLLSKYPYMCATKVARTEHEVLLDRVISLIPENASVLTINNIFPHVCHRSDAYTYIGWYEGGVPKPVPEGTLPDYILLDTRSRFDFIALSDPWLYSILPKYGLVASVDGILLYKLNYKGDLLLFEPMEEAFEANTFRIEDGRFEDGRIILDVDSCAQLPVLGMDIPPGTVLLEGTYEVNGEASITLRLYYRWARTLTYRTVALRLSGAGTFQYSLALNYPVWNFTVELEVEKATAPVVLHNMKMIQVSASCS